MIIINFRQFGKIKQLFTYPATDQSQSLNSVPDPVNTRQTVRINICTRIRLAPEGYVSSASLLISDFVGPSRIISIVTQSGQNPVDSTTDIVTVASAPSVCSSTSVQVPVFLPSFPKMPSITCDSARDELYKCLEQSDVAKKVVQ